MAHLNILNYLHFSLALPLKESVSATRWQTTFKEKTMTEAQVNEARSTISPIASQLVELQTLSFKDLRHRWQEVFGEPAKSNNKDYLRRRIAYRIQELAEGGLSEQAKIRIEEINRDMPLRLSPMPEEARPELADLREPATVLDMPTPNAPSQPRDPRLPPAGTTLMKTYRGELHEVIVREATFEYRGQSYRSLSSLAKQIAEIGRASCRERVCTTV